jgi:hypothetical protein
MASSIHSLTNYVTLTTTETVHRLNNIPAILKDDVNSNRVKAAEEIKISKCRQVGKLYNIKEVRFRFPLADLRKVLTS